MVKTDPEHWRARLLELIADLKVSQATFAHEVEMDASYVSRLLYDPEKKGRKTLGAGSMAKIRARYQLEAGWFDLPMGAALPSGRAGPAHTATPVKASELTPFDQKLKRAEARWPFVLVSYQRLTNLRHELGAKMGNEAIKDIDETLEILVLKWERKRTQIKAQSG